MHATEGSSIRNELMWYMEITAYCAVNCYALISGFVGLYSKHKYSSLALLWIRVFFYSVLITVLFRIFLPGSVNWRTILLSFFPVLSNQYWYFTAYFVLFLFIPVLNLAVERINKRRLQVLLCSLFVLFSVVFPVFNVLVDSFSLSKGYSPWWLLVLYLLGGYIRKHGLFEKAKKLTLALVFFASVTLAWLSRIVIRHVTQAIFGEAKVTNMWVSYLSVFILLSAVSLFLLFKRISFGIRYRKIISFLVPLSFSVYLIHTNQLIFDNVLNDSFMWVANIPVAAMVPVVLGGAVIIFVLCCLIDLIRHYLFRLIKLKERLERIENRIIAWLSA